jgi:predicted RNase H-like nuclease (RuvC/YqgF family)
MDQRSSTVPEQVRKLAPKNPPRGNPTDEAGRALIALLHQAAGVSNESCERASGFATKLAGELRAVEERIKELEAEIAHYRERARRAEEWLHRIKREIEDKLAAPQATPRTGPPGTR